MADTAAHLVDRVFPHVPVRQWVLSLPFALRYRLAYDAQMTTAVLQVFIRVLFGLYRRLARDYGLDQTQCGAVTFIQRFGSAANLHVHFHVLAIDGVYAPGLDGKPEFFPLRPPENAEVADLAQVLAQRVGALLKRRGGDPQRSDTEDSDRLTRDHPGWPTSMRLPFAVALPQARTPAATLRLPETESIRKRSIAEAAPDAPAWRVSASTLTSPFLPKTACGLNDCAVMRRGRLWQPTAWRLCRTGDFATGLRLPGVMEPPTRFSNPWSLLKNSVP